MKKYIIFAMVLALILIGCSSKQGSLTVESREYSGDLSGLEYDSWDKTWVTAEQGKVFYKNDKHHISATVESVAGDNIKLHFSNKVVLPERKQENDIFYIMPGKTYIFIAGGGVSGLEIKVRYTK